MFIMSAAWLRAETSVHRKCPSQLHSLVRSVGEITLFISLVTFTGYPVENVIVV